MQFEFKTPKDETLKKMSDVASGKVENTDFENKCEKDKDNIKQCDDLCDECKEIMKNELSKISKCQSVVNRYSPEEVKIGQKLLFGEKQSDIESTLQNRGSLINIDNIVYNNLDNL